MSRAMGALASLIGLALLATGCTDATTPTPTVQRIIDGDTLTISGGDRVRIIGIDAPERGECGHTEATDALTQLAPPGAAVTLTHDRQQPATDRYGRTLAYIDIDGTDIGLELVETGAVRLGYRFDREATYTRAATDAEANRRGLYQLCG